MLSKKEVEILKLIITEDYINMSQLEDKYDVTDRTIRRYISDINKFINKFDLIINYSSSSGYKITQNLEKLNDLLFYLNNHHELSLEYKIFLDILNGPITSYDLESRHLYSESTIKKRINDLNSFLGDYDLKIVSVESSGFNISGTEEDIRKFLYDKYFFLVNNVFISTTIPEFNQVFTNDLMQVITKVLQANKIVLTDYDYSNLVILFLISIYRFNFEVSTINEEIYSEVIKEMTIYVNQKLGTTLGLNSITYISKNSIIGSINVPIDSRIDMVINRSIERIKNYSNNYYNFGQEFKESIKSHIDLLIKRGNSKNSSRNPILNDIKQNYMMEFSDSIIISQEIFKEFNLKLSEDDIGYIAIHLGSSKNKINNNRKAVLISNYGVGTSKIAKLKIESENRDIDIIGVFPVVYLDYALSLKPDLVISTTRLENYKYTKPLVVSEQLLIDGRIPNINFTDKEYLIKLFSEKLFFDISVDNKIEFFNLSKNLILSNECINEEIFNSVIERESTFSTDFIDQVAIPHIIHKSDYKSFISVFRLKKSIKWTNHNVRLVFIILINERDKEYIQSLKILYEYILKDENIKTLITSKNFDEFLTNIIN